VRKAAAALVCLLAWTVPPASAATVFDRTYTVARPFGGSETVSVRLATSAAPVVVRPDPGNPARISVFARTSISLTVAKYEESGGYAHGIDWWVDGEPRNRLLYAYAGNGSEALGSFPSGTTIELELYRIDVFFYEPVDPRWHIGTNRDTTGPSFTVVPAPGPCAGTTVEASPVDEGVGLGDDASAVTTWTLSDAATGQVVGGGQGTRVELAVDGSWSLAFRATDLLGNPGTWPPAGEPTACWLVDLGPPRLGPSSAAVQPRPDGDLDVSLSFLLLDDGAGVRTDSPVVSLACTRDGTVLWERGYPAASLSVQAVFGGLAVACPPVVTPRPSTLVLGVAAEDLVGHRLDPGASTALFPLPPPALHAAVLAAEVTGSAVPSGDALLPRYRVPIRFDRPAAALVAEGVAGYRLTRTIVASGEVETVVELPPVAFAAGLEERGGAGAWLDELEGARYAHATIAYRLCTAFACGGGETVAVEGIAVLPDIDAWQVVIAKDGRTVQACRSGSTSFAEVRVRTPEGLAARIGPDPEGDEMAMRLEATGPGVDVAWPPDGWLQTVDFTDVLPAAPDGAYQVRFVVRELPSGRVSRSPSLPLRVDRSCGEIDGEEVWTGGQVVTGPITINAGGRLTIDAGATVWVSDAGDPASGSPGIAITVRPGGTLVLRPGCVLQPLGWRPEEPVAAGWAGIVVEGTALVEGAIIRGAARAVAALAGSTTALRDALVDGCRTGVHAVGPGVEPVVERTRFSRSTRYGIKEDDGASPIVVDCTFDGNTVDYYDTVLTAVPAGEIDSLEPGRNHGNRSGGVTP
jgi:hypothetical protein